MHPWSFTQTEAACVHRGVGTYVFVSPRVRHPPDLHPRCWSSPQVQYSCRDSAGEWSAVQQPLSVAGLRWQGKPPDNLSSFWCDSTWFQVFARSSGIPALLQLQWSRTGSSAVSSITNKPNALMGNNSGSTEDKYTRPRSMIQMKLEIISGSKSTNLQRFLHLPYFTKRWYFPLASMEIFTV